MERQVATRALAALLTVLAALVGARAAGAEGGGQNQFPCTPKTLPEAGALLPDLVPDQQLLEDDHVVWRDPQTGQFLLAFSAGIKNLGAGTLNVVGYRDRVAGSALPDPNTIRPISASSTPTERATSSWSGRWNITPCTTTGTSRAS
jgi:hypothetical protein